MGMGSPRRGTAMSDINVTPLVDVMLVLLIIFMVTAPLLQQGLSVQLPETTASGAPAHDEPFILVISANGQVTAAGTPIPILQLKKKLMAIFKIRQNKQVYIQADRRVSYGTVAEVLAEIKAAGIFQMSLITLPKTQ